MESEKNIVKEKQTITFPLELVENMKQKRLYILYL
jgi:hypothetical protein